MKKKWKYEERTFFLIQRHYKKGQIVGIASYPNREKCVEHIRRLCPDRYSAHVVIEHTIRLRRPI